MANHNGTPTNSQRPKALFEPFSWHMDFENTPVERLAETAQDVGNGIHVALQLIERSELDEADGNAPLLALNDRSHLMRLAITSARMLADTAERHIDWTNEKRRNARTGGAK